MQIWAIRTPVIQTGDDLLTILQEALPEAPHEDDVLMVTSKVVALEQGRVVRLSEIKPSERARQMTKLEYSKHSAYHDNFAELVLREAEKLIEGKDGIVYLTLKNYIFIANAGIDLSNVPEGYAVLWPEHPWGWTHDFRQRVAAYYGLKRFGVVMTDSHVTPLRRGVTGVAMAYAGIEGVDSQIGKPDLFGRPLRVTEKAVADDLAAASVLVTGEAAESTPFALVRDAPVTFTDRRIDELESFINPRLDLYAGVYSEEFKALLDIPTPRGGLDSES